MKQTESIDNDSEDLKSDVNIKGSKKGGYFIQVNDQYSDNSLAVSYEELERIVLYGQQILKSEVSND